ncbi:LPS O-antigen length regulator [compost metagenome]
MTSVSRIPSVVAQDEIDLFHILGTLWRRKALILSVAFIVAALGGAYAFLATPTYEVSTVLRPAALNDLDALNRSQVYSLPPGKALVRVGAALDSYDTRLNYFRSKPELVKAYTHSGQAPDQAFSNFNDSLVLVQPDSKKADLLSSFIGLKMRYEQGLEGAAILNDFVSYAIDSERAQLAEDLKVIVNNRLEEVAEKLESAVKEYDAQKESKIARLLEDDAIKRAELQDELRALRVELKMRREARLIQLEEAISIARSLGLKKPATPSSMAEEVVGASNIVRTEVNSQQVPLYFMGADVLEAERNTLRKRVSDDFTAPRVAQIRKQLLMLASNRKIEMLKARQNEIVFLEGVEALRAERARLERINTDMQQLRLVIVDQSAVPPTKPIAPRKALIILAALFGGLVIGVCIALMRSLFKARLRQVRLLGVSSDSVRIDVSGSAHS